MASTDTGGVIESTGYLACNRTGLSRLEILQQQQQQQYHLSTTQIQSCEHNCVCVHNHHPLINHHHHSNLLLQSPSSSPLPAQPNATQSTSVPFNPHHHFTNPHHHHHPTPQQHLHSHFQQQSQQQHDSNLIYNNSSTNSDCNQATSNNDSSQSGCSNVHYVPTSNCSVNSQNLNIPNLACDCGSNCQAQQHGIHLPRQQSSEQQSLQSGRSSSRIVSCDENNPSGTEDGSGMSSSGMMGGGRRTSKRNLNNLDNQQRLRSPKRAGAISQQATPENEVKSNQDDIKYSNRIDIYSDGTDSGVKIDEPTSEDDRPPRLPPRPPPRPRNTLTNDTAPHPNGVRKYVIWCLILGGISCLIGVMFLGVYFLLRSYTSTVGYFETVPTFVPATLLLLTGLCIISLARRRNRYSYLLKTSFLSSIASALTCALTCVTTTVLHMSRLQALRECEYTQKTRTCTCYSVMIESQIDGVDDGVRFVFDATADCSVVHGALYSCLRAVFGLSVAGVLTAVFSCMLIYQLLSHERKKMYWEQLELRCRSLYSGAPPGPPLAPPGPAIIGTPRGGPCRCCEQCHAHRSAMPSAYPWDGDSRFWAPGQSGNFYSPNPGGDEGNRLGVNGSNQRNRSTGWWPRMPWQRNETTQNQTQQNSTNQQRFRQTPTSPDSQYGFSNGPTTVSDTTTVTQQASYSVIGNPYGVWGPPPPYSDPNSPARRANRYQYIHTNQCHPPMIEHIPPTQPNLSVLECHQHQSSTDSQSIEQFCPQQSGQLQPQNQQQRNALKRQTQFKTKDNYENTPSDSDGGSRDRFSNTLPVRKTKKRVEIGANKSIGPNQPQQRINVQNVFNNLQSQSPAEVSENEYNEPTSPSTDQSSKSNNTPQHAKNRRIKLGIENTGFQPIEPNESDMVNGKLMEPTESEVYFADVSSCCNISVKNDNYYEDANQRRNTKNEKQDEDDYLSQRFGKRENSVRSRLPFPQMIEEDYEKSLNQQGSNKQMNIPVVPAPRTSLIPKDISRQSMCSIDSGEKTDFTDLSPATPNTNFQGMYPHQDNFVATFPYNEQSQEAHRRQTKNLQEIFLAPDAQYETIKDSNQYETTPLTLNYELSSSSASSSSGYSNSNTNSKSSNSIHFHPPTSPTNQPNSPKTQINLTPIKRQNLGTNISAIIQNLSGNNDFLYPENPNNLNNNNTNSSSNSLLIDSVANNNNNNNNNATTVTTSTSANPQDCNNVINSNITNNAISEKQKEWSDLNNDRRL